MTAKESFDDFPIKDRQKQKKGRANVEKRGGAREIVKSLQWLSFPLVYWGGTIPSVPFREDYLYRPVQFLLGKKLKGLPIGIYAIRLVYGPITPESENSEEKQEYLLNPLVDCIPVNENLISRTSRSLQAARNYPRALPKIIPDAESWLDFQSEALHRASTALRAISKMAKDLPETLAVEETCLWLGADRDRPSQRVIPESILSWMEVVGSQEVAGKKMAAIVLGKLKKRKSLSDESRIWVQLGSFLSSWPVDVVTKLPLDMNRSSAGLLGIPGLNHSHVALAIWEWLASGNQASIDFLKHLSSLDQACSRLQSEPKRRYRTLLQIMTKTVRNSREKVAENIFIFGINDGEADSRMQFFADIFTPNYLEFLNKQGLSLNVKELSPLKILDFSYRYAVGISFPTPVFRYRRWMTIFDSLESNIQYFAQQPTDVGEWKWTISGLAGRLSSLTKRKESIHDISQWMELCRIYSIRDENEKDLSSLAVCSLETGIMYSKGDRANLDRLLFIISEPGHLFIENILKQHMVRISQVEFTSSGEMLKDLITRIKVISNYGLLTTEQCRFVVTRNLINCTETVIMRGSSDSLKTFVQWLGVQEEGWFDLYFYQKKIWARLFRLNNHSLVRWLSRWATETAAKSKLSWNQISQLLNGIMQFCVSEGNLEDNPYEPDDFPDEKERQQFILDNAWIMDSIVDSIKKFYLLMDEAECSNFDHDAGSLYRCCPILEIGYQWKGQQYQDEKKLVTSLLNFCNEKEEERLKDKKALDYVNYLSTDSDFQKLMVMAANGDVSRFMDLITRPARENINYRKLIKGWEFGQKFPGIIRILLSQFQKRDHQSDVFRILNLLETVRMLPEKEQLALFFKKWEQHRGDAKNSFPYPVPEATQQLWLEYVYCHALAGTGGAITEKIQRIIDIPSTIKNEYFTLLRKEKAGKLDESASKRLEKISGMLQNSESVNTLINEKLFRLLSRQVPLLKMKSLENGILKVIRQHWRTIVKGVVIDAGDPDWDNALWLYLSINKNRRILGRLLNRAARQDRQWIIEHPLNHGYLKKLEKSGVDTGAWINGWKKTRNIDGQIWKVYTENNPLKIFHMGNMFNTCLRVGGIHDYSVVANAVEINKRVLYLENESGKIMGRKLLIALENGKLIGCHSYGSCDSYDYSYGGSPWVKIIFDLFCLELIEHCKMNFLPVEATISENKLALFSHWYFDGVEDFDCWVRDRLSPLDQSKKSLLPILYGDIQQKILHDTSIGEDILRLFIWLGDDLLPILDDIMASSRIEKKELQYVARFTQSFQVKQKIKGFDK